MSSGRNAQGMRAFEGDGIVVTWEPTRCQHSTECVRGLPEVFDTARRPWITPRAAAVEDLVVVIDRCPSYALGYRVEDGRTRVAPD